MFEIECDIPDGCPKYRFADVLGRLCWMVNPYADKNIKKLYVGNYPTNTVLRIQRKWRAFIDIDTVKNVIYVKHVEQRSTIYKRRKN